MFEDWREVPLNPKAVAVLACLVEHPGSIVTKDELLREVWGLTAVTDDALVQRVQDVRKALRDDARNPAYIRTHPKRGYEWIGHLTAPVETALPSHRPWVLASAVTFILLATAALFVLTRRSPEVPSQALSVLRLTSMPGMEDYPAFDHTSGRIAFASTEAGPANIWILDPRTSQRTRLTNGSWNESEPDWSPDGRWIAFRSERGSGGLFAVSSTSGETIEIASYGHHPRWSPDSRGVVFHTEGGAGEFFIWDFAARAIIKVDVTAPRVVNRCFPVWSPDGRNLYFLGIVDTSKVEGSVVLGHQIWRLPAAGGEARVITHGFGVVRDGGFDLDPSGSALVFIGLDRSLWKQPLARRTGGPLGAPVRLTLSTEGHQHPRFAASGDIAFATVSSPDSLWLIPFAKDGSLRADAMERLTRNTGLARNPALSPDGRRVAYITWGGERFEIWCVDIASRYSWRVSPPSGPSRIRPLWSRDGKALVYTALEGPRQQYYAGWFDDAGAKIVREQPLAGSYPLHNGQFSMTQDGRVEDLRPEPDTVLSPNQRLPLRLTTHGLELAGKPVPLGGLLPDDAAWSQDERGILFVANSGGWFNVWRVDIDPSRGHPIRAPRQLTAFRGSPYLLSDMNRDVAVHQRGLILSLRQTHSDLWVIR